MSWLRSVVLLPLVLTAGCSSCRKEAPKASPRVDQGRAARIEARATMTKKARIRSVAAAWREAPPQPLTIVAWAAAEESNTSEAWGTAAEAFEAELTACEGDCTELAYDEVLARRNAMEAAGIEQPSLMEEASDPVPLPAESQGFLDALDRYIEVAPPGDPDVAGMQFLAARTEARYRQPGAIERLEMILMMNRDHETAEYAANVLLNELMRRGLTDKLAIWVDRLSADTAWLADKPELVATLAQIRQQLASR